MFKKLCMSIAPLLLLAAVPAMAEEPVPLEKPYNCDFEPSCEVAPGIYGAMSSPVTSKFKLSLGGYVKLDYAHNSNASGPTTNSAGASTAVPRKRRVDFHRKAESTMVQGRRSNLPGRQDQRTD